MKKIDLSFCIVFLYIFASTTFANSKQVVENYFEAVKSHDVTRLLKVFSKQAIIITDHSEIQGLEQIRKFYLTGVLSCHKFAPEYGPFFISGNEVAVEITLHCDGLDAKVGDFFTIENGKISSLRVYSGKGYKPSI